LAFRLVERGLDPAGAVERLFGEEDIHLDAERGQIGADQAIIASVAKSRTSASQTCLGLSTGVADLVLQRLAHRDQVVAGIGAVLERDLLAVASR
jgi:hypothetical protein